MTTEDNNVCEEKDRLKQYKNLGKHEELRRRRTECSVEIRKQKNADLLMKRRNLQENDSNESSGLSDLDNSIASKPVFLSIPQAIDMLTNNPSVEQMQHAFESIRRMLSKSKNPPVDEVIKSGLLTALVQALSVENDKVKFEASWALTNIVSGTSEQTLAAVKAGACKPLVDLCVSKKDQIAEQALWAVANIAGDSSQLRDYAIECGLVDALLSLVNNLEKLGDSFARTLAWAFSNMCRHKNPHAPLNILKALSTGLAKLIAHSDKQVKQDSCWAVSYLTDGPDEQIALARDSGVLPIIIRFLREQDPMVAPALRVLGNMATGNDELTQTVIDLGTLAELVPLLERCRSSTVVKEACWLISNIIAGTQDQIQAAIDANLIPLLIEVLNTCQFEACWAIANLCQGGNVQQIYTLVQDKAVPVLCNLLNQHNTDMLTNTLESLYIILGVVSTNYPQKLDDVKDSIEESGGLELCEKLQEYPSEKIYQNAYRLVDEFFGEEENDAGADQNVEMAEGNQGFNF